MDFRSKYANHPLSGKRVLWAGLGSQQESEWEGREQNSVTDLIWWSSMEDSRQGSAYLWLHAPGKDFSEPLCDHL